MFVSRVAGYVAVALIGSAVMALPSSAGPAVVSPTVPGVFTLPHCSTPEHLDCVETVGIVDGKGKFWRGQPAYDDLGQPVTNDLGNVVQLGSSAWTVQVGQSTRSVRVSANLETPVFAQGKRADGEVYRYGALRAHVYVDEALSTTVRFVVRTSWLKPLNVAMYAQEALHLERRYGVGTRWVLQGRGTRVSSYATDFDSKYRANANADTDGEAFYFIIDHAATPSNSAYDPGCAQYGYTTESSNATSAGQPYWNQTTQALEFAIGAPHADTAGKPITGYFRLWVNERYIDCRWPGNTLSSAPSFTVRILSPDGEPQAALTEVQRHNGRIYFGATGFHYSRPTVQIRAGSGKPEAAQTHMLSPDIDVEVAQVPAVGTGAAKPAAKKTITCVKGKVVRKVTAVAPKCPAGFKKK